MIISLKLISYSIFGVKVNIDDIANRSSMYSAVFKYFVIFTVS
jgi:hypothetical protein